MTKPLIRMSKYIISTLLIVSVLNGCGFKLRGDYLLAPELQTIYVSSIDKHGELTRIVKQYFKLNDIKLVTSSNRDIPELKILKDALDRRTLSVFPNGQVAEYEIIYTVRYELMYKDKDKQFFEFELNRDYLDDPDIALAKSRELTLMLSEMRTEAAQRILRDLSKVKL